MERIDVVRAMSPEELAVILSGKDVLAIAYVPPSLPSNPGEQRGWVAFVRQRA